MEQLQKIRSAHKFLLYSWNTMYDFSEQFIQKNELFIISNTSNLWYNTW